jgi:heme-binding NEAT domain protein
MLFRASSRVRITGLLIVMMMTILLLVPQTTHAEQVNGEYTIGFSIMHADKKNASIAEGYWNQPAKVFIKDGNISVQTTINKHAWVSEFAISHNGSANEVKTLSVDEAVNTRITEFQVANFTDLVESNVSVYIEEIDYEHSYTMYFKFKPETLTLVKAAKPQVPIATAQAAAPVPAQVAAPADPAEEPMDNLASTAAPTSPPVTALEEDEKEATHTAGEAGSDEGAAHEQIDVAQQEKDAPEISVIAETADTVAAPAEETVEEGSDGSNIALIITIIIVLAAIIAVIVYRARHNRY